MFNKSPSLDDIKNEEQWKRHSTHKVDKEELARLTAALTNSIQVSGIDSPEYKALFAEIDQFQQRAKMPLSKKYWRLHSINNILFLWLPALCAFAALAFNLLPTPDFIRHPAPWAFQWPAATPTIAAGVATLLALLLAALGLLGKAAQYVAGIALGFVILLTLSFIGLANNMSRAEVSMFMAVAFLETLLAAALFAASNATDALFTGRLDRNYAPGKLPTGFPARVRRRWLVVSASAAALCVLSFLPRLPGVMPASAGAVSQASSANAREAAALKAAEEMLPLLRQAALGAPGSETIYGRLAAFDERSRQGRSPTPYELARQHPLLHIDSNSKIAAILARNKLMPKHSVLAGANPMAAGTALTCPGIVVIPAVLPSDWNPAWREKANRGDQDTRITIIEMLKSKGVGYARVSFGNCQTSFELLGAMKNGKTGAFKRPPSQADVDHFQVELIK
jgi:hypothetical protein